MWCVFRLYNFSGSSKREMKVCDLSTTNPVPTYLFILQDMEKDTYRDDQIFIDIEETAYAEFNFLVIDACHQRYDLVGKKFHLHYKLSVVVSGQKCVLLKICQRTI